MDARSYYLSAAGKLEGLKMYTGMTREEAIAWRMEVYGEREKVAANIVDEAINPQPKKKKSLSEDYADLLDIMYR